MKKLLFCSFLSLSSGLSGQTMDQGDSFISLGGGLGSTLIVTYEYGLFSNITIGPFLGIYKDKIKTTTSFEPTTSDENTTGKAKTTTTFQTTTSEVNTTVAYTTFGGLANYHFFTNSPFDVYAGAILGLSRSKVNASSNTVNVKSSSNDTQIGVHLGGRYFFTDHFAIGLELGYSFSPARIFFSYRF